MENKRNTIKRNDLLLITGIIVAALLLYILLPLFQKRGGQVLVTVDGKQVAAYSLKETIDTDINTPWGDNHLKLEEGVASITNADCKDKLCVHQRAISRKGETIVCLPHRLVISIEGTEEDTLDGITS